MPIVPILSMPVGIVWLRGSIVSFSTNLFSVPIFSFLHTVVHLLSFASSGTCLTFGHVLLRWRRVLFQVLLQDGPILSLSLR